MSDADVQQTRSLVFGNHLSVIHQKNAGFFSDQQLTGKRDRVEGRLLDGKIHMLVHQ